MPRDPVSKACIMINNNVGRERVGGPL
jgi:hypothetical protein